MATIVVGTDGSKGSEAAPRRASTSPSGWVRRCWCSRRCARIRPPGWLGLSGQGQRAPEPSPHSLGRREDDGRGRWSPGRVRGLRGRRGPGDRDDRRESGRRPRRRRDTGPRWHRRLASRKRVGRRRPPVEEAGDRRPRTELATGESPAAARLSQTAAERAGGEPTSDLSSRSPKTAAAGRTRRDRASLVQVGDECRTAETRPGPHGVSIGGLCDVANGMDRAGRRLAIGAACRSCSGAEGGSRPRHG